MKMTPTDKDFINVGFNGKKAAVWDDVCAWLRDLCENLPRDSRLTTRDLLTIAKVENAKAASQALWRIRKENGIPAGCWEQDMTRRFMGNPIIIWRKPPAEVDTSIF
jgi:hypothetical protein